MIWLNLSAVSTLHGSLPLADADTDVMVATTRTTANFNNRMMETFSDAVAWDTLPCEHNARLVKSAHSEQVCRSCSLASAEFATISHCISALAQSVGVLAVVSKNVGGVKALVEVITKVASKAPRPMYAAILSLGMCAL